MESVNANYLITLRVSPVTEFKMYK